MLYYSEKWFSFTEKEQDGGRHVTSDSVFASISCKKSICSSLPSLKQNFVWFPVLKFCISVGLFLSPPYPEKR